MVSIPAEEPPRQGHQPMLADPVENILQSKHIYVSLLANISPFVFFGHLLWPDCLFETKVTNVHAINISTCWLRVWSSSVRKHFHPVMTRLFAWSKRDKNAHPHIDMPTCWQKLWLCLAVTKTCSPCPALRSNTEPFKMSHPPSLPPSLAR